MLYTPTVSYFFPCMPSRLLSKKRAIRRFTRNHISTKWLTRCHIMSCQHLAWLALFSGRHSPVISGYSIRLYTPTAGAICSTATSSSIKLHPRRFCRDKAGILGASNLTSPFVTTCSSIKVRQWSNKWLVLTGLALLRSSWFTLNHKNHQLFMTCITNKTRRSCCSCWL